MNLPFKRLDPTVPLPSYARVGDAADATVRRVANHTSGLPLHWHFFYEDEPWDRPAMDETIRRYGNLVTIPGERHEYSNLGFGVLDYVIARTSGRPFEDYMRQQVFIKLGLTHTSVGIGPGLEPDGRAAVETGQVIPQALTFDQYLPPNGTLRLQAH